MISPVGERLPLGEYDVLAPPWGERLPLGEYDCLPLGGKDSPWVSMMVSPAGGKTPLGEV